MEDTTDFFFDLKAYFLREFARLGYADDTQAFAPGSWARRFAPDVHSKVALKEHVGIFLVRELGRLFAGSDEQEQLVQHRVALARISLDRGYTQYTRRLAWLALTGPRQDGKGE